MMERAETSTTQGETGEARARQHGARRRFSLEVLGEIVLLVIVGGLFVYILTESAKWPLGSALMPWIAVAIGAPFWVARLIAICLPPTEATLQIMDIGFRTGEDAKGERARFFRICSFIVGLYLAIWLLGFHIALPAGVFFYMFVYGRAGWGWSLCVSLLFLALIVGLYDRFLGASWHDPLVFEWLQLTD